VTADEGTEAFEAAYHVDLDDEDEDEPEPEDEDEPARRLVTRSVSPEDELSTAQRLRQAAAENVSGVEDVCRHLACS
jgi:hypothetical protein